MERDHYDTQFIELVEREIEAGTDAEIIAERVEAKAGPTFASFVEFLREMPPDKQQLFVQAVYALIDRMLGTNWLANAEETMFWLDAISHTSFAFWDNDEDAIYDNL